MLILSLYILSGSTTILQPSVTMLRDFRIPYCNKNGKLVESHIWKLYGEYICNKFHLILKYSVDGPMIVLNDRNV
jgi:hypothetical protein